MKNYFIIISIFILSFHSKAQYFQSLSNFYMNGQYFNPAYAGSREVLSSTLTYRNQWIGLEGAPKTMSFGFHTPLKHLNLASGFVAFTDKIGVSRLSGLAVNYVYRIRMKEGKRNLAFGLKTGILSFRADHSELKINDAGDNVFNGVIINQSKFDFGFGIYYYAPNYFFSISTPLFSNFGYNSFALNDSITTKVNNTYITTGFVLKLGKDVELMPSLYVKSIKNDTQLDLNLSFIALKTLLFGINIRSTEALVFNFEYQINQQLRLGYAHDFVTSPLHKTTTGTHEITIRYEHIKQYHVHSTRFF